MSNDGHDATRQLNSRRYFQFLEDVYTSLSSEESNKLPLLSRRSVPNIQPHSPSVAKRSVTPFPAESAAGIQRLTWRRPLSPKSFFFAIFINWRVIISVGLSGRKLLDTCQGMVAGKCRQDKHHALVVLPAFTRVNADFDSITSSI